MIKIQRVFLRRIFLEECLADGQTDVGEIIVWWVMIIIPTISQRRIFSEECLAEGQTNVGEIIVWWVMSIIPTISQSRLLKVVNLLHITFFFLRSLYVITGQACHRLSVATYALSYSIGDISLFAIVTENMI